MQLSVVILNYNVCFFLEQCVRSVQQALLNIESEIIVVDNLSTDASSEMMHKTFPDVCYIENKSNVGFPRGNNIGVAQAKGKYVCILNPDTVVPEDVFLKLLAFAGSKSDLGIVGCPLIDGRGAFLPESKRGIPTPWVSFCKALGLYKMAPKSSFWNAYYAPKIAQNQTSEVEILVGAFMFLEKKVYQELGGFDEYYFMYSEDIDLSYTCLKSGRKNYYFSETAVLHYKGESTPKDLVYRTRFREGMQYFYQKHFSKSILFDLVMRFGSLYFILTKKRETPVQSIPVQRVFVVTSNQDLYQWAQGYWKQEVFQFPMLEPLETLLKESPQVFTEIVFDGDCLSNKEILQFMRTYSSSFIFFKIKPLRASFIIGSNDSNDKGTIIKIDEGIFENHYNKSEILLNL